MKQLKKICRCADVRTEVGLVMGISRWLRVAPFTKEFKSSTKVTVYSVLGVILDWSLLVLSFNDYSVSRNDIVKDFLRHQKVATSLVLAFFSMMSYLGRVHVSRMVRSLEEIDRRLSHAGLRVVCSHFFLISLVFNRTFVFVMISLTYFWAPGKFGFFVLIVIRRISIFMVIIQFLVFLRIIFHRFDIMIRYLKTFRYRKCVEVETLTSCHDRLVDVALAASDQYGHAVLAFNAEVFIVITLYSFLVARFLIENGFVSTTLKKLTVLLVKSIVELYNTTLVVSFCESVKKKVRH
jgi:hypothetical protein